MNHTAGNITRQATCISVVIIVTTLILDRLIPEGLFLDGITYAAVSRNLAIGKGNFWALYYREEWIFSEHPPLMFGMQALFFKFFGDHYLTEKIYSFVIWLITAIFIRLLWNSAINKNEKKYTWALPLLLWCIIPTVTWGYTGNILDCTMAMFDLAAVLVLFKAFIEGKRYPVIALIMGGLLIFAATFTKGPVGAFPLAIPGLYWLVFQTKSTRRFGLAVAQTLLLAIVVAACYYILYQFPASRANLERYFNEQLLAALSGRREITGGKFGRFALVVELAMQLLPAIGLVVVLFIVSRLLKLKPAAPVDKKSILFFLLVAVSASLPILLSVKQRSFYLIPSFPFYIFALALAVLPYYIALTDKSKPGTRFLDIFRLTAAGVSVLLCIYLGSKVGQAGRDHELIQDMKYLGEHFPKEQVFGICEAAQGDYAFLAYLQRYNRMEASHTMFDARLVLINKAWCGEKLAGILETMGYKQRPIGLEKYLLYEKKFPLRFDFMLLNPVYRKEDK